MAQDYAIFQERRRQLAKQLDNGIVILPTALEYVRNAHTNFPFRADSHFYYLTGFDEPASVLVLQIASGNISQSVLFCRPSFPEKEIWDGPRFGLQKAKDLLGFDKTIDIAEFDRELPLLLQNMDCLYYPFNMNPLWQNRLMQHLNQLKSAQKPDDHYPDGTQNIQNILAAMRLIKDDTEIERMKTAARISSLAHLHTMAKSRPDDFEYELEAELLYQFRKQGAMAPAYPSIVASGPSACILHSVANNRQIFAGDLVLIDAGCEYQYYASDITRTWPIDGHFTAAQKDIYQLVLNAQLAAIDAVKPGNAADAPHQAAVKVLSQGLIDLGVLTDSLDTVLENELYKRFYMHRTSHWIGLDVHDVGPNMSAEPKPVLIPNQLLTIEPGLYFPDDEDILPAYRHMGIRIEDTLLVTQTGHENITKKAPKTMNELENIIGQG